MDLHLIWSLTLLGYEGQPSREDLPIISISIPGSAVVLDADRSMGVRHAAINTIKIKIKPVNLILPLSTLP